MSEPDIKTLERKINSDLRKAQNNMFSGKNDEAYTMTEKIWKDIEKIQATDPNYRNLKSLEQKYKRLKQNLEKKLGKTTLKPKTPTPITRTTSRAIRSPPTSSKPVNNQSSDEDKLPSGVTKRLRDIERPLSQAENILSSDQEEKSTLLDNARYNLQSATGIFSVLNRMYSNHINHPDVEAVQERITKVSEELDALTRQVQTETEQAEKEKKETEKLSQEYVEKIRPYLLGGGVREKQLNLSQMSGKAVLLHQKELIKETKQISQSLELNNLPGTKTLEMEEAEKKLIQMIKDGEEAYNLSITKIIEEALTPIEQKLNTFAKDNEWYQDQTLRPDWLYQREKDSIANKMKQIYELVPDIISKSNPDLQNLENKLRQLEKENQERLDIIPKRTFMVPEKYQGENTEALKTKAGELVKEKEPIAEILKVHLIRSDWRIEDVEEFTDTSRTKIRHRITYNLPAQVAAQIGDKVILYNAHIAKNKLSDGSFSNLYGNLEDYPQTIAKENLPN